MPDTNDLGIASRQITKELLEELGIRRSLCERSANLPSQAEQLISEYSKYYSQLWKTIIQPGRQE